MDLNWFLNEIPKKNLQNSPWKQHTSVDEVHDSIFCIIEIYTNGQLAVILSEYLLIVEKKTTI